MSIRVKTYEFNGIFSGELGYNDTKKYKVGGIDLGFPLYDKVSNKLYLLFGDTFQENNFKYDWRSNSMCLVKELNDKGQIIIDHFLNTLENKAHVLSEGHHKFKYEVTRIPTGAIEVNGVYYFYYFSMHQWKYAPNRRMNLGGLCKSIDQGKTWEKVNDVTFLNDLSKPIAIEIMNEDNNFKPIKKKIEPKSHLNHSFTQIFPYDGKDGYVYLFAEGGYRNNPLRLGRVKYEDIEKYSEYEYLIRYENGKAIFEKGDKARRMMHLGKVPNVCDANSGEMSLIYNEYLKKYCIFMTTDKPNEGNTEAGLYMFMSDTLVGPYKDFIKIADKDDPKLAIVGMYAPMTHETLTKNNGKDVYLLLSQWIPLYNPITVHLEFEKN
ncbi:MAG: DUF4185 domain-containing protein [Bacilli bacterium]|nr:DUF4185 domain-containing protein [Bacilli bacterium]